MSKISKTLGFPESFFFADDIDLVTSDSVSFRALTTLTAKQRDSAIATGTIATLFSNWIENEFNLPKLNVPNLRGHRPETAAEALRNEWGLGVTSIKNMVHLLEANGIRVFSLTKESRKVDAFCFWENKIPHVFINTTKSPERCRFDAAHELGHLVLHRHGVPHGKEVEKEADQFASAFLMPKDTIFASNANYITLDGVVDLKRKWSVSAMALIHRLSDIGIISDWHNRQLCIQGSKRGYRRQEPNGIAPETSQLLAKILLHLRQEGITLRKIAIELNLRPSELNDLMFGLVPTAINDEDEIKVSPTKPRNPSLRLV